MNPEPSWPIRSLNATFKLVSTKKSGTPKGTDTYVLSTRDCFPGSQKFMDILNQLRANSNCIDRVATTSTQITLQVLGGHGLDGVNEFMSQLERECCRITATDRHELRTGEAFSPFAQCADPRGW